MARVIIHWTANDLAALKRAYENTDKGINAVDEAHRALPHRTRAAIILRASTTGLSAARMGRLGYRVSGQGSGKTTSSGKLAPAIPTVKIKVGKCDAGDREFIRRRIYNWLVPALAKELNRVPDEVCSAMIELGMSRFAPSETVFSDEVRSRPSSPRIAMTVVGREHPAI